MEMYKRAYEKPDFEEVKMAVTQILCYSDEHTMPEPAPEMSEPEW